MRIVADSEKPLSYISYPQYLAQNVSFLAIGSFLFIPKLTQVKKNLCPVFRQKLDGAVIFEYARAAHI